MTAPDLGARNIGSPALWVGFVAGVLILLAIDLRVTARRDKLSGFREAMWWSVFWIFISLAFGSWVWAYYGGEQGLEFFAGYLLEKSLSVDNLFVFVLLFRSFAIPRPTSIGCSSGASWARWCCAARSFSRAWRWCITTAGSWRFSAPC